jgi:hypothetical protein
MEKNLVKSLNSIPLTHDFKILINRNGIPFHLCFFQLKCLNLPLLKEALYEQTGNRWNCCFRRH